MTYLAKLVKTSWGKKMIKIDFLYKPDLTHYA